MQGGNDAGAGSRELCQLLAKLHALLNQPCQTGQVWEPGFSGRRGFHTPPSKTDKQKGGPRSLGAGLGGLALVQTLAGQQGGMTTGTQAQGFRKLEPERGQERPSNN